MLRLLLVSLALTACTPPARTPTNQVTGETYALVPLSLGGGDSRHSSVQSSSTVTGTLEIDREHATLSLTFDTFVGHVRCGWKDGEVATMQQCADDNAKDSSRTRRIVLRGDLHVTAGELAIMVRDGDRMLALTCAPSFLGLACNVNDADRRVFGFPGDSPATIAFASPTAKRFELVPADVKDVGRVGGTIEMTGASTIAVALAVDGGPPTILRGEVHHQDADDYESRPDQATVVHHGHGLLFTARTSPTRTFSARCKDLGERLVCEVTADRSVLGKPEHISYVAMVLIPQRG